MTGVKRVDDADATLSVKYCCYKLLIAFLHFFLFYFEKQWKKMKLKTGLVCAVTFDKIMRCGRGSRSQREDGNAALLLIS